MPYMYRGIGTGFCGQRDFREGGSFVTTEWIFFVLPVIPLRSLRVLYECPRTSFWQFPEYVVTEVGPPCWKQVASVYAFLFLILPLPIVPMVLLEPATTTTGVAVSMMLLALAWAIPFLVPWLLRRRARRRPQPCLSLPPDSPCQTISSIHIP